MVGTAAPVLDVTDVLDPLIGSHALRASGIALFTAGLAGTLYAQIAMGESWRIGVDEEERTDLVTDGPFALVRNPIFAAMLPTSLGLTMLVPNAVALIGLAALIVALEIQVRLVEEPYLLKVHGGAYSEYASRVGRFLPGVGRLRGLPGRARTRPGPHRSDRGLRRSGDTPPPPSSCRFRGPQTRVLRAQPCR